MRARDSKPHTRIGNRPVLATAALLLVLGCAAVITHGAPAAWHKWRSKVTRTDTCAQVSPGEGWEQVAGPFRDAQCTLPGKPGQ
ncbi:hypothetical protein [Noviherbaspirillum sp. Root189]|uniref:hypothetical protein n=1 Tax=Noviherbaspirillum sp. Root189 TaxID=1736487 RepID=UPI001F17CB85|nr:hypothetical protein [Noviherbaspirillum sp. Root189]